MNLGHLWIARGRESGMFVLLEHTVPAARSATASSVHWDFLVEVAGLDRLPTWRLARDPRFDTGAIPAQRTADHRRVYLNFEGPLSDNRGSVRRLDRGDAVIRHLAGAELRVDLRGAQLRGRFEVVLRDVGELVFRRDVAAFGE